MNEDKPRILIVGADYRGLELRLLSLLLAQTAQPHERDDGVEAGYLSRMVIAEVSPALQIEEPKPKHNNGKGPRGKWGKLK